MDGLGHHFAGVESFALGGIVIEASIVMLSCPWRGSSELGCRMSNLVPRCKEDVLVLPICR